MDRKRFKEDLEDDNKVQPRKHTFTASSHENLLKSHLQSDAAIQNRLQSELQKAKDENSRLQKVLEKSLRDIEDKDNQLASLNNEGRRRIQAELNQSRPPGPTNRNSDISPERRDAIIKHFNVIIQRHHDLLNQKKDRIAELKDKLKKVPSETPKKELHTQTSGPHIDEVLNKLKADFKNRAELIKKEYDQVEDNLTDENKKLEKIIDDLQLRLNDNSQEIQRLKRYGMAKKNQPPSETTMREIEALEKENEPLKDRISELENELDKALKLDQLAKEVQTLINKKENTLGQIQNLEDEINKGSPGKTNLPDIEKECKDLKSELSVIRDKMNITLNNLKSTKESEELNKNSLVGQLNNIRKQYKNENDLLNEQLYDLQKEPPPERHVPMQKQELVTQTSSTLRPSVKSTITYRQPEKEISFADLDKRPLSKEQQPRYSDISHMRLTHVRENCEACKDLKPIVSPAPSAVRYQQLQGQKPQPPQSSVQSTQHNQPSATSLQSKPSSRVKAMAFTPPRANVNDNNVDKKKKSQGGCCGKRGSDSSNYTYQKNSNYRERGGKNKPVDEIGTSFLKPTNPGNESFKYAINKYKRESNISEVVLREDRTKQVLPYRTASGEENGSCKSERIQLKQQCDISREDTLRYHQTEQERSIKVVYRTGKEQLLRCAHYGGKELISKLADKALRQEFSYTDKTRQVESSNSDREIGSDCLYAGNKKEKDSSLEISEREINFNYHPLREEKTEQLSKFRNVQIPNYYRQMRECKETLSESKKAIHSEYHYHKEERNSKAQVPNSGREEFSVCNNDQEISKHSLKIQGVGWENIPDYYHYTRDKEIPESSIETKQSENLGVPHTKEEKDQWKLSHKIENKEETHSYLFQSSDKKNNEKSINTSKNKDNFLASHYKEDQQQFKQLNYCRREHPLSVVCYQEDIMKKIELLQETVKNCYKLKPIGTPQIIETRKDPEQDIYSCVGGEMILQRSRTAKEQEYHFKEVEQADVVCVTRKEDRYDTPLRITNKWVEWKHEVPTRESSSEEIPAYAHCVENSNRKESVNATKDKEMSYQNYSEEVKKPDSTIILREEEIPLQTMQCKHERIKGKKISYKKTETEEKPCQPTTLKDKASEEPVCCTKHERHPDHFQTFRNERLNKLSNTKMIREQIPTQSYCAEQTKAKKPRIAYATGRNKKIHHTGLNKHKKMKDGPKYEIKLEEKPLNSQLSKERIIKQPSVDKLDSENILIHANSEQNKITLHTNKNTSIKNSFSFQSMCDSNKAIPLHENSIESGYDYQNCETEDKKKEVHKKKEVQRKEEVLMEEKENEDRPFHSHIVEDKKGKVKDKLGNNAQREEPPAYLYSKDEKKDGNRANQTQTLINPIRSLFENGHNSLVPFNKANKEVPLSSSRDTGNTLIASQNETTKVVTRVSSVLKEKSEVLTSKTDRKEIVFYVFLKHGKEVSVPLYWLGKEENLYYPLNNKREEAKSLTPLCTTLEGKPPLSSMIKDEVNYLYLKRKKEKLDTALFINERNLFLSLYKTEDNKREIEKKETADVIENAKECFDNDRKASLENKTEQGKNKNHQNVKDFLHKFIYLTADENNGFREHINISEDVSVNNNLKVITEKEKASNTKISTIKMSVNKLSDPEEFEGDKTTNSVKNTKIENPSLPIDVVKSDKCGRSWSKLKTPKVGTKSKLICTLMDIVMFKKK